MLCLVFEFKHHYAQPFEKRAGHASKVQGAENGCVARVVTVWRMNGKMVLPMSPIAHTSVCMLHLPVEAAGEGLVANQENAYLTADREDEALREG